jgi:hypothetical protein
MASLDVYDGEFWLIERAVKGKLLQGADQDQKPEHKKVLMVYESREAAETAIGERPTTEPGEPSPFQPKDEELLQILGCGTKFFGVHCYHVNGQTYLSEPLIKRLSKQEKATRRAS